MICYATMICECGESGCGHDPERLNLTDFLNLCTQTPEQQRQWATSEARDPRRVKPSSIRHQSAIPFLTPFKRANKTNTHQ